MGKFVSIVENTVVLSSPPDEVFAMLTEPDRLRRWLTVSSRIDLRAGGDYRFMMAPGHTAVGNVIESVPGKLISYTWNWDNSGNDFIQDAGVVSIEIEPVLEGTQVTLRHAELAEEQVEPHTVGWKHFMERLVMADELGDAGWDDWGTVPQGEMSDILVAEAALAILLPVMRQFTPGDFEKQTPCEDFDVQALFEHLLASLIYIASARGADMTHLAVEDATAESRISAAAFLGIERYIKHGIDGTITLGDNEVPAVVGLRIIGLELLVHAWDFAKAIGVEIEVAPQITDFANPRFAKLISGNQPSDAFSALSQCDKHASGIEQLAAITGRGV